MRFYSHCYAMILLLAYAGGVGCRLVAAAELHSLNTSDQVSALAIPPTPSSSVALVGSHISLLIDQSVLQYTQAAAPLGQDDTTPPPPYWMVWDHTMQAAMDVAAVAFGITKQDSLPIMLLRGGKHSLATLSRQKRDGAQQQRAKIAAFLQPWRPDATAVARYINNAEAAITLTKAKALSAEDRAAILDESCFTSNFVPALKFMQQLFRAPKKARRTHLIVILAAGVPHADRYKEELRHFFSEAEASAQVLVVNMIKAAEVDSFYMRLEYEADAEEFTFMPGSYFFLRGASHVLAQAAAKALP